MQHLTVSEVARQVSRDTGTTVAPHVITNLFYRRYLDDEKCPVVGRVRLIPSDYVPVIVAELRARGLVRGLDKELVTCRD